MHSSTTMDGNQLNPFERFFVSQKQDAISNLSDLVDNKMFADDLEEEMYKLYKFHLMKQDSDYEGFTDFKDFKEMEAVDNYLAGTYKRIA